MLSHPLSQPTAVMYIGDGPVLHYFCEGKHLFCFWEREGGWSDSVSSWHHRFSSVRWLVRVWQEFEGKEWQLGECKALWGELERVSASSLLHWRWSLNPMSMSRSSGNWHTHAHLEDWRDATWRNSISIPCTCTRTWILDKSMREHWYWPWGRHVRPRACWERQETRSDWMSCTLLKTTGPYYCIVYCYVCTHQCGPCDNVHVQVSWVFSWSWSRWSPRLKRNPIRPDVMYFLLSGDKRACIGRRGSVALYCASVCALCAARCACEACDRPGPARKKYRAGEKAPAQR